MKHTIRSRPPLRIAFGGGGTDVSPYADEQGGLVLNATINRYAYVTLVPNDSGVIRLRSLDYDEEIEFAAEDKPPEDCDGMKLALGVVRGTDVVGQKLGRGSDLFTHTDAPPGLGLGASSTMVVALIGVFEAWMRLGLDRYRIARLAYKIEREDLGPHGGRQDQDAAVLGSFMYFFTAFGRRHEVERAIKANNAEVVHFSFTSSGLETWMR